MVFKGFSVCVLWTKVASALKGLNTSGFTESYIVNTTAIGTHGNTLTSMFGWHANKVR